MDLTTSPTPLVSACSRRQHSFRFRSVSSREIAIILINISTSPRNASRPDLDHSSHHSHPLGCGGGINVDPSCSSTGCSKSLPKYLARERERSTLDEMANILDRSRGRDRDIARDDSAALITLYRLACLSWLRFLIRILFIRFSVERKTPSLRMKSMQANVWHERLKTER